MPEAPAEFITAPRSNIRPELLNTLGVDTVKAIEAMEEALKGLQELAAQPNPFTEDQPLAPIRGLSSRDSQRLRSFPHSGLTKIIENEHNPRPLIERYGDLEQQAPHLLQYAHEQLGYRKKSQKTANKSIESIQRRSERFRAKDPLTAAHIISQMHDQLIESASAILGNNESDVLAGSLSLNELFCAEMAWKFGQDSAGRMVIAARYLEKRNAKYISDAAARSLARRVYKGRVKLAIVKDFAQATRERGSRVHAQLTEAAEDQQLFFAQIFLEMLVAAKARLTPLLERKDFDLVDSLKVAETYLANKAAVAERYMTEAHSRDARDLINRVANRPLVEYENGRRQYVIDMERVHLNKKLNLAKELLHGGRRLVGPDGRKVHKLADSLHEIEIYPGASAEERRLTPAEQGLMMAILTDHFEDFRDVITLVKAQGPRPDGFLMTVGEERHVVIDNLRNFDIDGAVSRLKGVLHQPDKRKKFSGILDDQSLTKITLVLEADHASL